MKRMIGLGIGLAIMALFAVTTAPPLLASPQMISANQANPIGSTVADLTVTTIVSPQSQVDIGASRLMIAASRPGSATEPTAGLDAGLRPTFASISLKPATGYHLLR